MSGRAFVDTNILLYAHDIAAGPKHDTARALVATLWLARWGVVSPQVLHELAANFQRKIRRPLDGATTRDVVANYLAWEVREGASTDVLAALDLAARYQVSFWDALILHAAQAAGVDTLYSEDLSHGQVYSDVTVINPFVVETP